MTEFTEAHGPVQRLKAWIGRIGRIGLWVVVVFHPLFAFAVSVSVMPAQPQTLQLTILEHNRINPIVVTEGYRFCVLHNGDIGKTRWVGITALADQRDQSFVTLQVLNVRFGSNDRPCDLFFGRLRGHNMTRAQSHYRLLGVVKTPTFLSPEYDITYSTFGRGLQGRFNGIAEALISESSGYIIPIGLSRPPKSP